MSEFKVGKTEASYGEKGTYKVEISKYKEKGKSCIWLKTESYDYDGDGNIDSIVFTDYDKKKNITSKERKNREYDEKGNLVKVESDYLDDGSIEIVQTREYDEKGNLVKINNKNLETGCTTQYIYNENNDKQVIQKQKNIDQKSFGV